MGYVPEAWTMGSHMVHPPAPEQDLSLPDPTPLSDLCPHTGGDDWAAIMESGLHFIVFPCGPSSGLAVDPGRVKKAGGSDTLYVALRA